MVASPSNEIGGFLTSRLRPHPHVGQNRVSETEVRLLGAFTSARMGCRSYKSQNGRMALMDAEIVQALHIAHKRRPAPCVPFLLVFLPYQPSRFVHLDLKLWKVTPRTLYR